MIVQIPKFSDKLKNYNYMLFNINSDSLINLLPKLIRKGML